MRLHLSLAAGATAVMMTNVMTITARRPHCVQVTLPSKPSPPTNRVTHPPTPEVLKSTLLLKPLRALAVSVTFLA